MRTSIKASAIVLFSAFLLDVEPGHAARPLSTEDAGVAGRKVSQLETSFDFVKHDTGDTEYSFGFVPVYGVTERFEFSVEFPLKLIKQDGDDEVEGLADVRLVAKALISEEGERAPAFTLKTFIKLDNGDEEAGFGSGDKDLGLVGVVTKKISSLTLHGNLGYTFVGKGFDRDFKNYILYGAAVEYPLKEGFNLVGELYGESNTHYHIGAFKRHNLQALVGFTGAVAEDIVFDAAAKVVVIDDGSDYGVTAGFTVTF